MLASYQLQIYVHQTRALLPLRLSTETVDNDGKKEDKSATNYDDLKTDELNHTEEFR